jgi:hypothetical protein
MKLPRLTRVTGIYGIEPFAGGFTEMVIASGSKEVRLRCDPDTDELLLSSGLKKERSTAVSIIAGTFRVTSMWSMTNGQGYSDGFRIELRTMKKSWAFEFIAAASAVEVYEAKKQAQPGATAQRGCGPVCG